MNVSDHWSITSGCAKTRSSEELFAKNGQSFGNVLKIIYSIDTESVSRQTEKLFEGEAIKRFKYRNYLQDKKFSENFNY